VFELFSVLFSVMVGVLFIPLSCLFLKKTIIYPRYIITQASFQKEKRLFQFFSQWEMV